MRAPQARWSAQASRGLQAPGVHPGKMGSLDARFLEIPEDMEIIKVIELSKEASQPWLQTEGFGCKQRYTFPEIPEYMACSAQPAGPVWFASGGTMKELHVARSLRESLL